MTAVDTREEGTGPAPSSPTVTAAGPQRSRRVVRRVRQGVFFGGLFALWWVVGALQLVDPFYLPAPGDVAGALVGLFAGSGIWEHLAATFGAAVGGLALGLVVGVVLGFAAALVPAAADVLEPVMAALNAVPRVVLAPLFVVWLGIGISSKVAVSFLLVSVLVFFSVYSGIREVDKRLVERVRSFGGGRAWLIREVYAPSVAAWVLGNLRVAVGFAFTGAVVGEFVASTRGLGYLLGFAQTTYNVPLVFGLIALVMALVLVLVAVAGRVERRLLAWRVDPAS